MDPSIRSNDGLFIGRTQHDGVHTPLRLHHEVIFLWARNQCQWFSESFIERLERSSKWFLWSVFYDANLKSFGFVCWKSRARPWADTTLLNSVFTTSCLAKQYYTFSTEHFGFVAHIFSDLEATKSEYVHKSKITIPPKTEIHRNVHQNCNCFTSAAWWNVQRHGVAAVWLCFAVSRTSTLPFLP